MNIVSCLNPKKIRNKVTGLFEYVPCGKCKACLHARSSRWVSRLEDESKCWPYTIFFTLTYHDKFVPKFHRTRDGILFDLKHNNFLDLNVEASSTYLDGKSNLYLSRRKNMYYLRKEDVQLFMKRLRYYFDAYLYQNHILNESSKVRYYIVGEYGPYSLRPHYHGILWFSSKSIFRNFDEILRSSWQFGFVDWSVSKGRSSFYCASYLNSFYHLPKIYTHPSLRPFSLCSKQPAIGTLFERNCSSREIFDRSIIEVSECKDGKNVLVPISKNLENTLFPRCKNYCALSHSDRVSLYGISKFSGQNTFYEFVSWCLRYKNKLYSCQLQGAPLKPCFDILLSCINDYLNGHTTSLYRIWSDARRVEFQSLVWSYSIDHYVSKIERYYEKKELVKLRHFYEWQIEYSESYPVDTLFNFDHDFSDILYSINYYNGFHLDLTTTLQLSSFGVDVARFESDELYRNTLSLKCSQSYNSFIDHLDMIYNNSTKTKRKNDYLKTPQEYDCINFINNG